MSKLIQVLKDACDQLDIIKEEIINLEKKYQWLKQREFIDAVKLVKARNHPDDPQIGDKYIIEIGSHMTNKNGDLYGIKGFNALVFDKNGLEKLEKLTDEVEKIFGSWHLDQVFDLSAQEAMEKLKVYEQRNKYKAGDIVKDKDGKVYMCYGADDASVTMGNGKEVLIIPPEFNKAYTLCYNVFDGSRIGDDK